MPQVTSVELWSNLACAGGARLALVPDRISVSERTQLDGQDELVVTFPRQSGAWASVREGRVVRLQYDDNSFDEWRIGPQSEQARSAQNELTASLTCAPVLQDLLRGLCKRAEADGLTYYDFEYLGLTPAALVALILADAPAYFAAGTIAPTAVRDLRFAWSTPLEALRGLAEVTRCELAARRNGSTNYLVDLVTAIGSGASSVLLLTGKNLTQLARRATTDAMATRLIPRGAGAEGEARTIARARWRVDAKVAAVSVDLTSPVAGEDGPAQVADQFNATYLREVGGALRAITDTVVVSATLTRLSVAVTAGFTVGDLVELRLNAAGDDLTYLEDPANAALYGTVPKVYPRDDIIPGTQNLVANPELNGAGAGGAGAWLPTGWLAVGTPTTDQETGGDYTRRGGKSCRVQADAAGEGLISAAIAIAPSAAQPYFSASFSFRIVSGRWRVELTDETNGRVYPDGTTGMAVSSQQGTWTELGVEGLDLNAVACASVKLRIVADGAAGECYVDSAQLTQTAAVQPFLAGDGARQLWQAANDELADRAVPQVSVALGLLDLQRFDRVAWPYDALVLGGTVVVRDTDLGIDVTTRITSLTRDLLTPMATQVVLSNRSDELTDRIVRPRLRERLPETPTVDRIRPVVQLLQLPVPGHPRLMQVQLGVRPVGSTIYYVLQTIGDAVPARGAASYAAYTLGNPINLDRYAAAQIQLSAYGKLGAVFGEVQTWIVDKDSSPSVSVALSENPGGTLVVKWTPDDDVAFVDLYRKKNGDQGHSSGGGEGYPVVGHGAALGISSITRAGGVATVTLAAAANPALTAGQIVVVSGAGQAEYNGSHVVTGVTDSTHFTYAVTGTPVTPATGTKSCKWAVGDQSLYIGRCSPDPEGFSVARDGLPLGVTAAYGSVCDDAGVAVDGIGSRWWIDDATAYVNTDVAAVVLVPLDRNLVPGTWGKAVRTMSGAATATLDSLVASGWLDGSSCADGASCTVSWTGSGLVDGTHHVHVYYRINGGSWTELLASPEGAPASVSTMTFDDNALYGRSGGGGGTDNFVEFRAELQLDSDHSVIDERTDAGTTISSIVCTPP